MQPVVENAPVWLIECPVLDKYLSLCDGTIKWEDCYKALQFARKVDAIDFMKYLGLNASDNIVPTEHIFG